MPCTISLLPSCFRASNAGVELGEEHPSPGHVVGGAGVEVPVVDLVATGLIAEEDVGLWLIEVEERGDGRRGSGVQLDAPVYENTVGSSPSYACPTCD